MPVRTCQEPGSIFFANYAKKISTLTRQSAPGFLDRTCRACCKMGVSKKTKEELKMAMETKVILKMIYDIIKMSKTKKEALEKIASYVNEKSEDEGVPWEE